MPPVSPILIDIGRVADHCCTHDFDEAFETLHKALSNPPDGDIWSPHYSPFISALIERFTKFGLDQNQAVVDELQAWLAGARTELGAPSPGPMQPWALTSQELGVARLYLAHLPLEHWTLSDYELMVEYLIGRYLPPSALRSVAEKYAVHTSIMGRVQALQPALTADATRMVVAALPTSVVVAQAQFRLPAVAQAVMDYGYLHCAEAVAGASDKFRHQLKTIVLDHQSQVLYGAKPTGATLQQRLFDALGETNRDWRRIALTEAAELSNQGLVAAMTPGERLRRLEAYAGACPFCRRMDTRIFKVVKPEAPDKDWDNEVWPGKTNVGRSAAPMMRGVAGLIPRPEDQQWKQAAGCNHPHCRGVWHREAPAPTGVSDEFSAWLEKHLAQGRHKE